MQTKGDTIAGQGEEMNGLPLTIGDYIKIPAPLDTATEMLRRMNYECWTIRCLNNAEIAWYSISKNGQDRISSIHSDLFVSLAVAYALNHVGANTQEVSDSPE